MFSGRYDILLMMNQLIDIAESLGCKVILSYNERIRFNEKKIIYIPPVADLKTLYALAHEMGHLKHFLEGELCFDSWLDDRSYRINAEMVAWVNAYDYLKEVGAPFDNWESHVQEKLYTYFETKEVV